jgi:geranylgeranyl diphosphate synthase type I
MNISALLIKMRSAIEADLQASLAPLNQEVVKAMGQMIAYHLGWSQSGSEGKRVRPTFTLLCCAAVSGTWENALPAASAVEWIHNFSLIHDDIQDQSATRRGRETLWTREGVAQAINTGDAVFALARLATQRLTSAGVSPEAILQVKNRLDQACLELTKGQYLDIDFETRENVQVTEYMDMIAGKTAALLEAACSVGALIGDADPDVIAIYGDFGRNVGLAFQMFDDLLGIWGETESTGKPTGDDLSSRKKTLPILYGIEKSKRVKELWGSDLISDDQIQTMIGVLEESGAKTYGVSQAEKFTKRALAALHQAQPLQPFGEELENLALSLLRRVS